MAYEDYGYDPMGNVTGFVDQAAEAIALREEEERKRKEEERARKENEKLAKDRDNLAVHKQEVTTYANGSKTITNVAEVPATANAPGRPNAPVKGPVAPETFARMQQAESGNRDYDAQGRPVTSPVGAMFKNQVMPATANAPGFGIRPAQAQTPEEYNRVGQEYYQAMLKKFDGNEQAAVAAYNAGPGRVDQNMRKNQGQLNVAQLPQETQGYLNKVLGGVGKVVNAVIPSAQAGTLQQPPANVGSSGFQRYDRNRPGNAAYEGAPKAQSFQGQTDEFGGMEEPRKAPIAPVAPDDSVINNQVADYERRQQSQPAPVAPEAMPSGNNDPSRGKVDYSLGTKQSTGVPSSAGAIDAYQSSQNDPMQLMKLGTSDDPNVPDWIKTRSRDRAADMVTQQREMAKAKEQVSQMSDTDLAKSLRKKTEGGSYAKLFLYNLLGMDKSAAEESAKLGMGDDKVITGSDGKSYMVKIGINGTPLEGFSSETGKKLSAEELVTAVGQGTNKRKVSTSAEMLQDKDGNIYRSQNDEQGNLVTKNIANNKEFTGDPTKLTRVRDVAGEKSDERKQGFRRENDATQFANSIRKLDYAGKLKAVEEFRQAAINRGEPDLSNEELAAMGIDRPDIGATPARQQKEAAPAKPQQAQGQAEPQAQGKLAPVEPTGKTQLAPVNPNAPAPSTSVTGRMTPVEQKRREKDEAVDRAGREAAATTAGKVEGGIKGKELTNVAHAKEVYDLIQPIQTALKDATGSGLGTKVDEIAAFFGGSTKGAEASAQLKVLGAKILMNVPRFEGPQSDKDVAAYKEAAGSLADSTLPIKQRSAALKTIIDLNKKYAPDLDWDFSKQQTRQKVIGGVTYVHDGKGWKAK